MKEPYSNNFTISFENSFADLDIYESKLDAENFVPIVNRVFSLPQETREKKYHLMFNVASFLQSLGETEIKKLLSHIIEKYEYEKIIRVMENIKLDMEVENE